MASIPIPAPVAAADVAAFIEEQARRPGLDIDAGGEAYLRQLLHRAATRAIAIYRRNESFDAYAAALDESAREFTRLLDQAAVIAGFETIDERILRGARDMLCPLWLICD